jgi:hypothetical protein
VLSAADLEQRAEVLERRATALRRKAEMVQRTDVTNLDEPPAVDMGPDAVADPTAPTGEPNQLALADRPEAVMDGSETGLPIDGRGQGQDNPFQEVGPYARGASAEQIDSVRRDAGARVIRIAQLVDRRVDLGFVHPAEKFAEIAKFEAMEDGQLEGWIESTDELAAARAKVAGRRIKVAAGPGPELSQSTQLSAPQADEPDEAVDTAFIML